MGPEHYFDGAHLRCPPKFAGAPASMQRYAGAMTVTQHGPPGAPFGPAPGGPPGVPMGSPPPPAYDWRYAPPVARASKRSIAAIWTTAVVALAALVVGIVALATQPSSAPVAAGPSMQPSSAPAAGDTTEADRALCTAIGPLLAEENRINNGYVDLGDSGTPARDEATARFISDTLDWISRVQPIVDQHPDVDPFLQRSTQRFIDDVHLIVLDLEPGPLPQYLRTLFSDSVGAFSGPLHICERLGVTW